MPDQLDDKTVNIMTFEDPAKVWLDMQPTA